MEITGKFTRLISTYITLEDEMKINVLTRENELQLNTYGIKWKESGFKWHDKVVILPTDVFARIIERLGQDELVKLWNL